MDVVTSCYEAISLHTYSTAQGALKSNHTLLLLASETLGVDGSVLFLSVCAYKTETYFSII